MRPNLRGRLGVAACLVAAAWLATASARPGLADEPPGRLARLFRLGGSSASSTATPIPPPPSSALPDAAPTPPPPEASIPAGPVAPSPRLVPQPRVSRAVSESDPILTRVSIGRSDSAAQFGLFLQVFADGTVLDSEGVHRVDREALGPLIRAIQAADTSRLKGHCGGPPTDFIEQVHVVVYERTLRGLRANAFSYSGNPQGCDPSVRALQAAVDALQVRIATPAPGGATAPAAPPSAPATPDHPPLNDAAPPPPPAASIPLTPAP